jgi:hypothetical protein
LVQNIIAEGAENIRGDLREILGLNLQIELFEEGIMQMLITFMAVALLAEELIFGQVFRLFFSQQPVRINIRQTAPLKTGQKR